MVATAWPKGLLLLTGVDPPKMDPPEVAVAACPKIDPPEGVVAACPKIEPPEEDAGVVDWDWPKGFDCCGVDPPKIDPPEAGVVVCPNGFGGLLGVVVVVVLWGFLFPFTPNVLTRYATVF